jgi:hypothetical protein
MNKMMMMKAIIKGQANTTTMEKDKTITMTKKAVEATTSEKITLTPAV